MLIFKPYLRFELLQNIKIININYNEYIRPSHGGINYKIHEMEICYFHQTWSFLHYLITHY